MSTCQWPVNYTSCGTCEALTDLPPEERALWEQMASDLLDNWTGGVFGLCEVVVRPCTSDCEGGAAWGSTFWGRGPGYDPGFPRIGSGGASGASPWYPVLIAGQWHNITCGCVGSCSCVASGPTVLNLPGPVQSVSKVLIDGVVLPATSYRVANQRQLIRTDGETWPSCQDMLAASTEPNTFEVTYVRGIPVPIGGQVAAGSLACELAKAACGDESCALPQRLQSITRQGLTVAMQLEGETFDSQTGIWAIDSWVASVNKPKSFVSVRSVDIPSRG